MRHVTHCRERQLDFFIIAKNPHKSEILSPENLYALLKLNHSKLTHGNYGLNAFLYLIVPVYMTKMLHHEKSPRPNLPLWLILFFTGLRCLSNVLPYLTCRATTAYVTSTNLAKSLSASKVN